MKRAVTILALALTACEAVGALLAGCSAEINDKVLHFLFDPMEKPPPPTGRVRRDLLQEIEDLKRQLAAAQAQAQASTESGSSGKGRLPVEQAKTWPQATELLPKDPEGSVDWAKALKDGIIAPRSGADGADEPVLSMDVDLVPEAGEAMKVVFSHKAHTAWLACTSCHPAIFEMKKGAAPITMAKINAGESCGVCHGRVAFDATKCARCHAAREELALDVTLKGAMSVTFPHAPHTRWLPCESCHTKLFPMTAGATAMTMEDFAKGRYCGACHGTLAFDTSACGRCHPGMGEG